MNPDNLPSTCTRREALRRAAVFLGVALAPSSLAAVLAEGALPPAPGPSLSPSQSATLAAVAEVMLPATDTPGAIEAGVPVFAALSFGRFMSAAEREQFSAGLSAIDRLAKEAAGTAFASSPGAGQMKTLQSLAQDPAHRPFLRQLRELVIVGYFTSEIVGKKVLRYDPVPGRWEADIPLESTGGIAWQE